MQLLVPLRGFVRDYAESRGDFSWNMYSVLYDCREGYERVAPNGLRVPVEADPSFAWPPRVETLYHRDRVAALHAWLCDWERTHTGSTRVEGTLLCALNGAPERTLVAPHADVCARAGEP